jgi:spore coat polysaccharide biosynthesis predicted glycosyltransferase SpsG
MSAPLVEIAVDGGAGFGFGHLSRSQTLASALRDAGAIVRFDPRSDAARRALAGQMKASDEPSNAPASTSADILVLDLPYADDSAILAATAAGQRVAVLDPLGEAPADLAIRTDPRPVPMAAKRCEYGLAFALIRREILEQAPRDDGHVLICVGGSDLGDLGVEAAIKLAAAGDCVILVRGPMASPLADAPAGVDVRISPPDLPVLMAGCRYAVTNAGTTALECMALGKAVHVLAQTEAERATAGHFLSEGLILGLGLETLERPDLHAVARAGAAGRASVDGLGAARVAGLILGLLELT